jgi:hypothetical protein
MPPMLQVADIEAALRQHLPAEYYLAIPSLAQALAEASTGAVNAAQAALPGLADALRALAGREVQVNNALITFGSGNQLGDVTINDVAGGNMIKLHFNLEVQQTINVSGGTVGKIVGEEINTGGGDYAEGGIDSREGAFVSGGTVHGPVVGSNQGTVNVTYNYYPAAPTMRTQTDPSRAPVPTKASAMPAASCFISYSTADKAFAQQLADQLRQAGISVWFAPDDVRGGAKLYDQIQQAIRGQDRLILVLSEHSMTSTWVATEIRLARKVEREQGVQKFFPIRLVDMPTLREWELFDADSGSDLAVEVREYFVPDFSDWRNPAACAAATTRILNGLQKVSVTS